MNKVLLQSLRQSLVVVAVSTVFALHAWIWLDNPAGMFAETNPRVSCGEA